MDGTVDWKKLDNELEAEDITVFVMRSLEDSIFKDLKEIFRKSHTEY